MYIHTSQSVQCNGLNNWRLHKLTERKDGLCLFRKTIPNSEVTAWKVAEWSQINKRAFKGSALILCRWDLHQFLYILQVLRPTGAQMFNTASEANSIWLQCYKHGTIMTLLLCCAAEKILKSPRLPRDRTATDFIAMPVFKSAPLPWT